MNSNQLRRRIQRDYSWNGSGWVLTNETRLIYDGNIPIQHRDASNLPTLTLTRGRDLSGTFEGAGGIGGLLALTDHTALHVQAAMALAYYGRANSPMTARCADRFEPS